MGGGSDVSCSFDLSPGGSDAREFDQLCHCHVGDHRFGGRRPGADIGAARVGWRGETPLWYYIQREADVRCGGNRLGPVGARIVGEVLVGLLNLDPASVRHAPDDWRPTASLIQLLGHA